MLFDTFAAVSLLVVPSPSAKHIGPGPIEQDKLHGCPVSRGLQATFPNPSILPLPFLPSQEEGGKTKWRKGSE